MHELGHNFELLHGGSTCDNYKPNYLSVMNYNFYTTGIPVGAAPGDTVPKSCVTDADCTAPAHCSGPNSNLPGTCFRIDYSGVKLADLNECGTASGVVGCVANPVIGGLDETKGLNVSPTSTDISTFTTDGITPIYVPTNGTPIDWNQDGTIEAHVTQDINGDGATTLLTGHNDWAALNFNYQCNANFANDTPLQAANRLRFQQLLQDYWRMAARTQPTRSSPSSTAVQVVGASGRTPARSASH